LDCSSGSSTTCRSDAMHLHEYREGIEELHGVGPVLRRRLERLGIRTLDQLLRHYPNSYQDRRHKDSLKDAEASDRVNVLVRVRSRAWIGRGYKKILKVTIEEEGTQGALLCFGRSYLSGILQPGKWFWVWGRFQRRHGVLQATDFEIEASEVGQERAEYARILPVYALTEGLSQNTIRQLMSRALEIVQPELEEELPPALREQRDCLPKGAALKAVHFPESMEQLTRARRTLVYGDLLRYQLVLGRSRLLRASVVRSRTRPGGVLKQALLDRLPFVLTADQLRVLEEIEADLFASHPGARLLQGEVGSGKTLVALASALLVIEAGEQAALMVPTELLARQHGDNAARLLEPLGVRVAFLSGSVQGTPRRMLLEGLRAGEIDLLIGTHALFSEEVVYRRLGLVIVDEQQRFGVAQRQALLAKGDHPDLLLMSATPIPRTLALSVFGQLDVSEIRAMPRGRKAVITHLARQGNEAKVYDRVRREIARGGQAYFVYPLIEESSALDLKNAERMYQKLKRGVFADLRLALIHSRVAEEQKIRIMQEFAAGGIDILVATSVLEVGVDIPRASCMVIEHAERFGLSSLHQLRGRVGRGERQSYAFLTYGKNLTESGVARLRAIMNSTNGFEIAEEDLKIRGPGEFLGQKQSGFQRIGIADLFSDWDLFLLAREDAREILSRDPELLSPPHRALRKVLVQTGGLG
jgi:ATP-dependent DNA helicase RecG